MSKLSNYIASFSMPSGMKCKGDNDFPLMEAHSIQVDEDGKRLDELLNEFGNQEVSSCLHLSWENVDALSALFTNRRVQCCTGCSILRITAIEYTITYVLSGCTATTKPTTIIKDGTATIELSALANCSLTANSNTTVSVTNCEYTSEMNIATGTIEISNPTGDIVVTVDAYRSAWEYTTTITKDGTTNVATETTTTNYNGVIPIDGSITLTFTANKSSSGIRYTLSALVTNATKESFEANALGTTYTLKISNPTGKVTIRITGIAQSIS